MPNSGQVCDALEKRVLGDEKIGITVAQENRAENAATDARYKQDGKT